MSYTFKIALVHPILNFRKFACLHAADSYAALHSPEVLKLKAKGYQKVESLRIVAVCG